MENPRVDAGVGTVRWEIYVLKKEKQNNQSFSLDKGMYFVV